MRDYHGQNRMDFNLERIRISKENPQRGEESMNKTLIAYFSASGVTARAAERLAKSTGADLYEIVPAVPYTDQDLNWMNAKSRSSVEMNDPASRPEIRERAEGMEDYDKILIGFPIWWNLAPTIINTFLESYDFSGKEAAVFATSGGSGVEHAARNLKKQYPHMEWKEAALVNSAKAAEQFADRVKSK